jgi:hypothetical protein
MGLFSVGRLVGFGSQTGAFVDVFRARSRHVTFFRGTGDDRGFRLRGECVGPEEVLQQPV